MTLLACKAMGATEIIVSDLVEHRLESAKRLGATVTANPKEVDVTEAVLQATGGKGCDVVFETAGSPVTMAQTGRYVKSGGVIVVVGNIAQDVSYNFLEISRKEVEIRTVFRYRNIYPLAIEAVEKGYIDLKAIEPKEFPFEQADEAFQYTITHAQEVIKTLIKVSD